MCKFHTENTGLNKPTTEEHKMAETSQKNILKIPQPKHKPNSYQTKILIRKCYQQPLTWTIVQHQMTQIQ